MDLPQHGHVDVNAAKWWGCKWKFFILQMSSEKMHMRMFMYVMQIFELILMEVQKFIAAFLFKNRLSCLILNFSDHHQEFLRVRSIWCFEKFSSTSLDLFPKTSQFDWKWDMWKFFLWFGSWVLDHWAPWKDFVLVNFKQIQCSFKVLNTAFWQTSRQTEMGLENSGWDILAWRVQILEVESFDGFQFHVNSDTFGS